MKKKWNRHCRTVLGGIALLGVLAVAFWYGGNAPGLQGWEGKAPVATSAPVVGMPSEATPAPVDQGKPLDENKDKPLTAAEKTERAAQQAGEQAPTQAQQGSANYARLQGMEIDPQTGEDAYRTQPVPEGRPVPVEPQQAVLSDQKGTCTLSVRCDALFAHMDWLDQAKRELIPKDGVILPTQTVPFYQGESVFNLLQRELKRANIHLEFTRPPLYNSAYIEGIHNLYEFDAGELSGWTYQVNGWFPNYGSSRYQLQEGDVVAWQYTCNLGVDVGGYNGGVAR